MGVYFGIIVGLILSALVQRLFWPVLPQWEMRDRVLELLRLCRTILQVPPDQRPAWLHQRLALIPVEASNWIAVMNKSDCPPDEPSGFGQTFRLCDARRAIFWCLRSTASSPAGQQAEKGGDALRALPEVMKFELFAEQPFSARRDSSSVEQNARGSLGRDAAMGRKLAFVDS